MVRTILFVLALFLTSCGYQFQGSGSILPPDVKTVYIPLAENNTAEPGIAELFTEALKDRFDRYGVVEVVENQNQADATLRAAVLKIGRETQTVTSGTDSALQFQTVLVVAAELQKNSGITLYNNQQLRVAQSFGTSSDVVVTSSADFASGGLSAGDLGSLDEREISRGQEQETLEDLSEKAAVQIYNEAVAPQF